MYMRISDGCGSNGDTLQELRKEPWRSSWLMAGNPVRRKRGSTRLMTLVKRIEIRCRLRIQIRDRLVRAIPADEESRDDRAEAVAHEPVIGDPLGRVKQAWQAIEKRHECVLPKPRRSGGGGLNPGLGFPAGCSASPGSPVRRPPASVPMAA